MSMSAARSKPPPENELTLGQVVQVGGSRNADGGFPAILCHDPVLQPHLGKPWVRAWIGRELGLHPPRRERHSRGAGTPDSSFARHCLTIGTSGSGKTRMFEHLFGQLLGRGQSLLALDPKLDSLRQIAAQAQAAGVAPEQITLVSPRAPGGAPGWNPFLAGLPAADTAHDFVALIEGRSPSWGPRLGDILANVALVVAEAHLSVYELMRALRDPDYLQALLDRPPAGPRSAASEEAADALAHEFLAVSKSARTENASAVTNKFRVTLRNDFIRDLLTARANTLDLSRLWKRQGVVLVHIDRASLGEEGAKLLAGMMASSLFRTSLRVKGPVPVNLGLDEISTAERFVGEILEQVAVFSRSANLRLLAAAQNLSQMGGPLQEALLSANVQVSFRLSPGDARLVAAALAAGTEPWIARVRAEALGAGRQGIPAPRSTWRHQLRDASGRPLRLDPAAWERLQAEDLFRLPEARSSAGGADPLGAISRLAAQHGMPRLYVRAADTGEPVEIRRYVAGMDPAWYWVDGPQPLALTTSFPALRLTGAERRGEADAARSWTRTLQGLPVQHAVLRVGGGEPVIMRVADVPETSLADVGPYLTAALRANGQSAEEVEACANQRRNAVLRLARGKGDPADVKSAPGTPAPRAAFRTKPPRQAGRPAAGTDTNSGGPEQTRTAEELMETRPIEKNLMNTDPTATFQATARPRSHSTAAASPRTAASADTNGVGGTGTPARRRSRYVRDPKAAVLTPFSLRLLEYVAGYRLVSLPQLVRLGEASAKATQRAMRALFDAGLVDIVAVPRAALAEPDDPNDASLLFGSAPNIYSATRAGIKFLDAHGLTDAREPPPGYGPKNALLLRHELGVGDVRIFLELAARRHPGQAMKAWHDGPEAVVDLGRAQPPKSVRPDAWFVYRLGVCDGREAVLAGFVEYDRATERGERRWSEKLAAYNIMFAGPRLREVTGYAAARILVVCPSATRRERLSDLVAELAGPPLARRVWLVERAGLDEPDPASAVWQRPGSRTLLPLVPNDMLST